MFVRILCCVISVILIAISTIHAQITSFPYSESFDGVIAPALPIGWSISGFSMIASTSRSSPNCVSTTGNTAIKSITSPIFDFTNRVPDKLVLWERRSGTASAYRFEVRASIDGIQYDLLLNRFDTTSSTSSYVQRIVTLAGAGLQQQSNVQFRWQLLGDNTNNTGVLRIDDVLLTVATGFDIGITRMVISPINALRKDSLHLTVTVKNFGLLSASGFMLRLFYDDNFNYNAESNEQFSVLGGLSLDPGDSLTCSIIHEPLRAGEHCFIAAVDFTQDENRTNDTIHTAANIGYVKGDMLVNEIMYAPTGDEPEWVEFLNASPDTVNLKNWRISDSNILIKSFISQTDVLVPPNSYLVVAKEISFSTYHPGVHFVTTSFAALNNTTLDAVVIFDSQFLTIDSVMYAPSWGGQNGKSLERIDAEAPGSIMTNWGTSQDLLGSTPGKINNIARLEYDLTISNMTQTMMGAKGVPVVNVVVCNIGKNVVDSVVVRFYADNDCDAVPELSELIQSIISTSSLAVGDSILVSESFTQLTAGETNIIILIDYWRDARLQNNQTSVLAKVCFEPRSLVINEIMYDPLGNQNEWIELLNRSNYPINLAQWTFNDKATSSGVNSFSISDTTMIVQPGGFVIIAAESSMCGLFPNLGLTDSNICMRVLNCSGGFSLNNDGDAIVLKDLLSQTIDSIAYLPQWHHSNVVDTRGRSLECINPNIESNDPRNWSTCTTLLGGTPGKANSIFTTSVASSTKISVSPNPFSPDGDGFEDFCMIHYDLPTTTSTLNIRIYDIKGRLIRTLANGELAGNRGEIIWNGFDENKQRARVGMYVVYLEVTDRASNRVLTAKAVAVVATRF